MVPAMERSLKSTTSRLPVPLRRRPRHHAWVGLVLVLGLGEAGCARLQSLRGETPAPPMIGKVRETSNIYGEARRGPTAGVEAMAASNTPSPANAVASNAPKLVEETSPGPVEILPAPRVTTEFDPTQPPPPSSEVLEGKSPFSARATVPDSGRRIASGTRNQARTEDVAQVVAEARVAIDRMATYQVAMHRQERVNGSLLPEEDVILAVRRQPRAIRLSWPSGPHQGREVIYRGDESARVMHINPGGPMPRMTLPVDSPLVMRNSRHPINEAGLDSLVEALESALKSPQAAAMAVQELRDPAGNAVSSIIVRRTPEGETWRVGIDHATHLPGLVECSAANGDLLERYTFQDLKSDLPELASAEAFDPNGRWGTPRGLFGLLNPDSTSR